MRKRFERKAAGKDDESDFKKRTSRKNERSKQSIKSARQKNSSRKGE